MDNNPINYSDLIRPDDSITKLISQLEKLDNTYTNTLRNIREDATQAVNQLNRVTGATTEGQRATRESTREVDRLTRARNELDFAQSENARSLEEVRRATREANTLTRLTARLNNSAEGSYDRLSAQYSINRIRLNQMTTAMRENTQEGQDLERQTRTIREEMQRLQSATGNFSLNVGNYPQQLLESIGLNGRFAESLSGVVQEGGGFSAAFSSMGTSLASFGRTALGFLSNPLFLALLGIAGVGVGVKFWYDYNVGLLEATKLTKQFTNESGNDLKALRSEIQATADMYNEDFKEVLIASNALAKQFGISQQQAIRLVQDGFISGANANGEYLETLKEYPAYFKEAGLSASEFVAITTSAGKSGIYSDKAVDTIKEGNLRIREMTKATADALTGIGLNYKELQKQLQDGSITTFDVMQKVSQKLNELPESSAAVGTAIADIFGGPGEDAGLQYLKTLKDIDTDLSNVKKNAGELGKLQEEQLRSNAELSNVVAALFDQTGGSFETLIAKGKILANDVLISIVKGLINVVNGFIEVYNKNLQLRAAVQGVITSFNVLWEVTKTIFSYIADQSKTALDALTALANLDFKGLGKAFTDSVANNNKAVNRMVKTTATELSKGISNINKTIKPIEIPVLTNTNIETPRSKATGKSPIANYSKKEKAAKETDPNAIFKKNLELQRKFEDALTELITNEFDKREVQTKLKYARQIEDLKFQLKTEKDLTQTGRTAILSSIALTEQQQTADLTKIENERQTSILEIQKNGLQLRLDAVKKQTEEEYNLKLQLIEKERQLELLQNKSKPEDQQQTDTEINAKYDTKKSGTQDEFLQTQMLRFDQIKALEQSEFDLLKTSEEKKTRFRLQAEKERLQKILDLNAQMGNKLTDTEVKTVENTIAKIDQEIEKSKKDERSKDIYGLFGLNLNDEQKEGISTSVQFAMDALNQFLEAKVAAADAGVAASEKEVDNAQRALDFELEARANGYANNVAYAQKELDQAKKNQEKALKEQEKARKQQAAIQTLQQIGNMITASTQVWSQLGFPWAIPALAVMWGSFAYSKIKASQIAKSGSESYGDGTVELLSGGSHQSGNDVDLGSKKDGTKRRAEGGEFFAVINKRNSRRYRKVIPDVIKSLNNGSFSEKYLKAYNSDDVSLNVNDNTDFSKIKDDVSAIRDQNKRKVIFGPNGQRIEIYKNLKRKIN